MKMKYDGDDDDDDDDDNNGGDNSNNNDDDDDDDDDDEAAAPVPQTDLQPACAFGPPPTYEHEPVKITCANTC